jgi:predicted short-subunit dehydrogenase-like oxidoreductase (DUF2520 family)
MFKHLGNLFSLRHNSRLNPQAVGATPQVKPEADGEQGFFHLHTSGFEPRTFFKVPGSQTGAIALSHHPWDLAQSLEEDWRPQ